MPHTCNASGCNSNQFGGGYCSFHQWFRKLKDGDLYGHKTKVKKQNKIPIRSKQRLDQEPRYKHIKEEIRTELQAKGQFNCIFCTKPMGNESGFHHFLGRIGTLFTDRKYLQPGHGKCHVEEYHRLTVEQLTLLPWYEGFLERIKLIDISLWEKEMRKHSKAEPVNVLF